MERSNSFLAVLAFFAAVCGVGCSSAPAVNNSFGTVTPTLIHERVRANIEYIRTLRGSGSLSMESPEIAGSGSFELRLRKPDSLMIRIEGPFGIEVGSALVTRRNFTFYNSLRNEVVTGATNSANLARTLRMSVDFNDLMNLFTGASFLAEDTEAVDDFRVEDQQYVLTYRKLNATRIYWIDPSTLFILRIQHLDATGKLVAEQRYNKYLTLTEGSFPSSVRYTMNSQRRVLSVFFDTIELNVPVDSFALDVPSDARRLRIE